MRKDGKEILYFDQDRIWSVRVNGVGAQLRFTTPVPLFSVPGPLGLDSGSRPLAVSRDGLRIYFLQSTDEPDSASYMSASARSIKARTSDLVWCVLKEYKRLFLKRLASNEVYVRRFPTGHAAPQLIEEIQQVSPCREAAGREEARYTSPAAASG